jgi:hypothetical protein
MTRLHWILAAGATFVAGLLLAWYLRAPEAVARPEDGSFANDCCGTIALDKGRIVVGTQKLRYEIGRDEKGPFLLPGTYVGPYEDRGFEVDGTRPPLKIRPDAMPRPETLAMDGYGRIFLFRREHRRGR